VLDIGMPDVASAHRAAEVLRTARGLNPTVEGTTVELNVDNGPAVVSEALRLLQDNDLAPTTLALREPSLDDVFLSLTGHRTESDETPPGAQPIATGTAR
jgi:ABC-2 type transport system ATP-binding protein